jgi:hypothetical protein
MAMNRDHGTCEAPSMSRKLCRTFLEKTLHTFLEIVGCHQQGLGISLDRKKLI